MGGTFESEINIERIEDKGDQIERIITNRGERKADAYVLCLGSWSPLLVRPGGTLVDLSGQRLFDHHSDRIRAHAANNRLY